MNRDPFSRWLDVAARLRRAVRRYPPHVTALRAASLKQARDAIRRARAARMGAAVNFGV